MIMKLNKFDIFDNSRDMLACRPLTPAARIVLMRYALREN